MKNYSNVLKFILVISIFVVVFSSACYAAWWGTPGYEWALKNKFTSIKTQSQLNEYVSSSDVYSVVINYLKVKNVSTKENKTISRVEKDSKLNNVISGVIDLITPYAKMSTITASDYRKAQTLVEYLKKIIDEQSSLLTKENIKDLDLYLSLTSYKLTMSIEDRDYRDYAFSKISKPKYTELLSYGVVPYAGNITRKEFLVMMYELLSPGNLNTSLTADGYINPGSGSAGEASQTDVDVSTLMQEYEVEGVLLGYENDMMLQKQMTYAEMFTFLHRFENVEFAEAPASEEDLPAEE